MVGALKGRGGALNIIARELALDLARSPYFPDTLEHLPGIANVLADSLSRRLDPGKQPWSLPPALAHVTPSTLPNRDSAWWRVRALESQFLSR